MTQGQSIDDLLQRLNPQQREAATHGDSPLLIVAGAGTGKTATLVHRVAWLIAGGVDPGRILLLTFTRRAAAEMLRRVENMVRQLAAGSEQVSLSGPTNADQAGKPDVPIDHAGKPDVLAAQRFQVGKLWGGTFHAIATRLCAATARRSACRPVSPSTTAPIPKT